MRYARPAVLGLVVVASFLAGGFGMAALEDAVFPDRDAAATLEEALPSPTLPPPPTLTPDPEDRAWLCADAFEALPDHYSPQLRPMHGEIPVPDAVLGLVEKYCD